MIAQAKLATVLRLAWGVRRGAIFVSWEMPYIVTFAFGYGSLIQSIKVL